MSKGGLRFYDYSGSLANVVNEIWTKACGLNPKGESCLNDGMGHCERVDQNLDRLVDTKTGGIYTEKELALLTCSAALHDTFKGANKDSFMDHGALAASKLPQMERFGIEKNFFIYISNIIKIHDRGNIQNVISEAQWDDEFIFIPRLAMLFKIADMLDCTYKRINIEYLKEHPEQITEKIEARIGIQNWVILKSLLVPQIEIYLDPKDSDQLKKSMIAFKLMENELRPHELSLKLLKLPSTLIPKLSSTSKDNRDLNELFRKINNGEVVLSIPDKSKYPIRYRNDARLMIVKKDSVDNSILMCFDSDWDQWHLPTIPLPFQFYNWEDQIKNLVINKYRLNPTHVNVSIISPQIYFLKQSHRHGVMTEFRYQLVKVELSKESEFNEPEFTKNSRTFKWIAVEDLVEIEEHYKENEDTVTLISRHFKIPFKNAIDEL